jgi:tetratricopeptide (TPR) repeat protein
MPGKGPGQPRKTAGRAAVSGKPSLAILYFENNTGDKGLDHWRTALSELLITDLSQSKYIRVLSGDQVYDVLRQLNLVDAPRYSTRDLKDIAARGNASHILRGGFTRAADTLRINFVLHDAKTGENIGADKVEGRGEASIYALVDEMSRMIKTALRLTPEEIASDPQFAMAWRGLAAVHGNLGQSSKSREYSQKAFSLSDRVSDRERHIIQAYFCHQRERTYPQAIEACDKLLELYPDDGFGNGYLGLIYDNLEDWEKSLPRYLFCYQDRKSVLDCSNLGSVYERLGEYDKARQVYQDYLKNVSDSPQIHTYVGFDYVYRGEYDLALAEAEKAFLLAPGDTNVSFLKGDIAHLAGRFEESEKEYLRALESQEKSYKSGARWSLATLFVTQGKFAKAKDELRLAYELAAESREKLRAANSLFYTGYLCLRQGQLSKSWAGRTIRPATRRKRVKNTKK